MNELIQANAAELLATLNNMLSSGVALVTEQMPLLVQEIIAYRMISIHYNMAISILLIALGIVSGVTAKVLSGRMYNGEMEWDVGADILLIFAVFAIVVGVIGLTVNIGWLLQIRRAPMVCVLNLINQYV